MVVPASTSSCAFRGTEGDRDDAKCRRGGKRRVVAETVQPESNSNNESSV